MTMSLSSPAFRAGQAIPIQFTCDSRDISPPLAWQGVAEGARSLALICDDPDAPAGTWVHWVLFNLPANTTALEAGLAATGTLPDGALQGRNDFRHLGYGGPCPPPGRMHHYVFRLYALDAEMKLPAGATKAELLRAMKSHILAQAELVGTYQRG